MTDGATPLHIAARNGQLYVAQLLIERGAKVNQAEATYGTTPLWIAAQEGQLDVAQLLIENGADVNIAHMDGKTPLYVAAENRQLPLVQLLLDRGADVNKALTIKTTPLYMAAKFGHADIVKALIENGADVNIAHMDGKTLLYMAAKFGQADIVKAIIENGADTNKAGDNAKPPLSNRMPDKLPFGLFCVLSNGAIINCLVFNELRRRRRIERLDRRQTELLDRRQTELLERVPIGELSETQIKHILESNLEDLTCLITYDTLDELTSIVAVGNHQNSLYSKAGLSNWLVGQISRLSPDSTFRDVATQQITRMRDIRDVTEAVRELLQNKQVTTTIQEVLADIITQISTDNEVEGEVLAVEPSDVAIMQDLSHVARLAEQRAQEEARGAQPKTR
jgi:ankyrin repeat protein